MNKIGQNGCFHTASLGNGDTELNIFMWIQSEIFHFLTTAHERILLVVLILSLTLEASLTIARRNGKQAIEILKLDMDPSDGYAVGMYSPKPLSYSSPADLVASLEGPKVENGPFLSKYNSRYRR